MAGAEAKKKREQRFLVAPVVYQRRYEIRRKRCDRSSHHQTGGLDGFLQPLSSDVQPPFDRPDRATKLVGHLPQRPFLQVEGLQRIPVQLAQVAQLPIDQLTHLGSLRGLARPGLLGHDVRKLGAAKLAVTGPKTAEALQEYSLVTDIQPASFRAEAVADAVIQWGHDSGNSDLPSHEKLAGKQVLLLRASRGRDVLAERIQSAGGSVEQVVAYESVDVDVADETVEEAWERGDVQWVTITSSAIARSLYGMWGERLRGVKIASISPITSETIRELGLEPAAEATTYTTEGLIDAIVKASA